MARETIGEDSERRRWIRRVVRMGGWEVTVRFTGQAMFIWLVLIIIPGGFNRHYYYYYRLYRHYYAGSNTKTTRITSISTNNKYISTNNQFFPLLLSNYHQFHHSQLASHGPGVSHGFDGSVGGSLLLVLGVWGRVSEGLV
jgi:hypothetical protein